MPFSTDGARHSRHRQNEAAPTGLRLLIEIWRREWWTLLLLNLLFIVACLPVVTIGPALAALTRVTLLMAQDQPVDLWHDFRTAFTAGFVQGFAAFAALGATALAAGWSVVFFLLNISHGLLMLVLFAVAVSITLLVPLAGFYTFAQIASVRLPLPTILNNAILMSFSDPKRTLPALFANLALTALPFLFPPVAPLVFLFLFSAASLLASLAVWPGLRDHVLQEPAGP